MSCFDCFNLELEYVFLSYFFSQKISLFRKTTKKFIGNSETLSQKNSHEYLPYAMQRFSCFQISLINNSRHPRGHFIHESSIVRRVSAVPSVVTTFPQYLLKTWNLNKHSSTLNLTWKPFKVEF